MPIPTGWDRLGFTSGRRTYRGNKLVGGVKDSDHLFGRAADFTAPLSQLRAMFPNNPILDEGDHRHVSGLSDVPYFGKRGTAGLVNGIDTSAPKAPPMRRNPIMEALTDAPLGFRSAQNPITEYAMAPEPQAPQFQGKPKGRNIAGGILGILGDALAAYGGQRGVFAPFMFQQMAEERQDNRARERLNATIQAQREMALMKAGMPKPPSQTERLIARVRDPNVPLAERQLIMQILTKPLVSFGADGSQTSTYGAPDGEDEWEYSD